MGEETRKGPRLLKVHELDLAPSVDDQAAVVFRFQDIQENGYLDILKGTPLFVLVEDFIIMKAFL